jgi:peptidoglycan/xylan/chitin deacetylase (PgdA/CDA1 family)
LGGGENSGSGLGDKIKNNFTLMKKEVRKIKLILTGILLLIVFALVLGVLSLNGDYYWQGKYINMQWLFSKTRAEYAIQTSSLFNNSNQNNFRTIAVGKSAQSVPILLYHGIITDPKWTPDEVNTRLDDFQRQMVLLKSLGYQTISLDDFIAFLNGEKQLPEKSFLLTFDDGRKDSYYPVDPILKALGYRAVMFVITGRSLEESVRENTFHLDTVELKKMVQSGRWEIESHTQNGHEMETIDAQGDQGHFLSNKLWLLSEGRLETDEEYQNRIENDLVDSKEDIEKKLGTKVKAFAYPFGDFGSASVNFSQSLEILAPMLEKIFPYSFYQARESDFIGNYPGSSHLLKRLGVSSQVSSDQLATKLLNSQDKLGSKYEDKFINDRGWMEGWGKRQFKNGLMLTGPTDSEDSSLTFLDGTQLWQDYSFESEVQLEKGKAFALLARYQDGNDYVSCDFGDSELSIEEQLGGSNITLAQISHSSDIFATPQKTGVSVKGKNVSCLINGKIVLNSTLDNDKLTHGGIGFKTWDNKIFNSELLVKLVEVRDISIAIPGSFKGAMVNFSER